MNQIKKPATGTEDISQVEGEGSYTGARQYDEATREFMKKGKVEQAARDAAPDSSAEAAEMEAAEEEGRRHAKEEDPALKTGAKPPAPGK
jgi:hypothetical protein